MLTLKETSQTRRVAAACAAAVLAVVALSLGQGGDRSFLAGDQLHLTAPAPLALVSLPFDITWETPGHAASRYAVFVDLRPIAPGHGLRDLATTQCKRVPSCRPTADYLQGLGVYLSATNHISVVYLAQLAGTASREPHPVHTATVVRMNDAGRRVGDSAWQVQFRA